MSSILDALNKLEHEKSRSSRPGAAVLDARAGVEDILPERPTGGRQITLQFSTAQLVVGGIAALVLITVVTFLSILLRSAPESIDVAQGAEAQSAAMTDSATPTGNATPPQQPAAVSSPHVRDSDETAQRPVAEASEPSPHELERVATAVPPDEADEAAVTPARPDTTATKDANLSRAPLDRTESNPEPARTAPSAFELAKRGELSPSPRNFSRPLSSDVAADTEQRTSSNSSGETDQLGPGPAGESSMQTRRSETRSGLESPIEQDRSPLGSTPPRTARADTAPPPESLSDLPLLTDAVAARNSLPPMQLNMVKVPKPGSPTPFPSAVINLTRVMVGERIQNSRAVLFQVGEEGVGIEIAGTDARYFLPLR